jgi:hypothetical protein
MIEKKELQKNVYLKRQSFIRITLSFELLTDELLPNEFQKKPHFDFINCLSSWVDGTGYTELTVRKV